MLAMIVECKDCDAASKDGTALSLIKARWECILITEDKTDPVNGWRCPNCSELWRIVVEERPGALQ